MSARLAVLAAVLLASPPASAAQPCPKNPRASVEIVPTQRNGGTYRSFPREAGGFDLFWIELVDRGESVPEVHDVPDMPDAPGVRGNPLPVPMRTPRPPRFATLHQSFSASGAPLTKPVVVAETPVRHIARGEGGTWALTVQAFSDTWRSSVLLVRIGDGVPTVRGITKIPLEGFGHSTMAIAWDAAAREWVLAGEEQFNEPQKSRGYVYHRVLVARLSADGAKWIEEPRYLTGEYPESGMLSDWTSPFTTTADGVAFVWGAFRAYDGTATVRITELVSGKPPVHHDVATGPAYMRGAIAKTPRGYAVSWGSMIPGTASKYEVKLALFEDGKAGAPFTLSERSGEDSAVESVIASDGKRVLVAWQQGWGDTGTAIHLAELPLTPGAKPERRALTNRKVLQHDWVQALWWDGCAFALIRLDGINPSAGRLERIP